MIDLSAFDPKVDCQFKTRTGKEYSVKFVSTISELKLLQEQAEISSALSNWKTIKQEQLDKWKQILISVLYEQENKIVKEDEKEINELYPLDLITIMTKLCQYLNDRSKVIYEVFPDDVKERAKKVTKELEDDIKKKITQA